MDKLLTIDEVAVCLKADSCTAYRLAANNELSVFKFGGIRCFRRGERDQWIARPIDKVIGNSGGIE